MALTREQKRAAIEAIRAENDDELKAQLVVDAARAPDNPLHGLFDWDQKKAANEHWKQVARRIIREVEFVVVNTNRTITSVAYVRDPSLPAREAGYVAMTQAQRDHEMAISIIQQELDRIIGAVKRARNVASALDLDDEFESLLALSVAVRAKVEAKKQRKKNKKTG